MKMQLKVIRQSILTVKRRVQRDYFFRDLEQYGVKRTAKKYVDVSFSIKRKIKSTIKNNIQRGSDKEGNENYGIILNLRGNNILTYMIF